MSSCSFERQQALVQEQLVKLAQREREAAAITNLSELTPALIVEKQKVHQEQDKAKLLVSDIWIYFSSTLSFHKDPSLQNKPVMGIKNIFVLLT